MSSGARSRCPGLISLHSLRYDFMIKMSTFMLVLHSFLRSSLRKSIQFASKVFVTTSHGLCSRASDGLCCVARRCRAAPRTLQDHGADLLCLAAVHRGTTKQNRQQAVCTLCCILRAGCNWLSKITLMWWITGARQPVTVAGYSFIYRSIHFLNGQ